MIEITRFTVTWVIVIASLYIIAFVFLLRKSNAKIPVFAVLIFVAAIGIRLLFPVEYLAVSKTLVDFNILPHIYEFVTSGEKFSILSCFCVVWALGTAVSLILYILKTRKLYLMTRFIPELDTDAAYILTATKKEKGYKFKARLLQSPSVEYPSECGILSQTIFLDGENYSKDELRYIFLHELAHFRYGTNHLMVLFDVLCIIFWWNPAVYLLKYCIGERIEMFVDSKATEGMTKSEKSGYMHCIFKVAESSSAAANGTKLINPLAGDPDRQLLKRFKMLTSERKCGVIETISVLFLAASFLFISCGFIVQPGWQPPAEQLEPIDFADLNKENARVYFDEEIGQYVLWVKRGEYEDLVMLNDKMLADLEFLTEDNIKEESTAKESINENDLTKENKK